MIILYSFCVSKKCHALFLLNIMRHYISNALMTWWSADPFAKLLLKAPRHSFRHSSLPCILLVRIVRVFFSLLTLPFNSTFTRLASFCTVFLSFFHSLTQTLSLSLSVMKEPTKQPPRDHWGGDGCGCSWVCCGDKCRCVKGQCVCRPKR